MIGERLKKKCGGGRDNGNPRFRLKPYYRTWSDEVKKKSGIDQIIIVIDTQRERDLYIWSTTAIIKGNNKWVKYL